MLLAAFYQLLEDRYGLALALITAAVFTKETTIFAPVAAAITAFILKRDTKWSAAMLAPLLIWAAARWLAFHAVMGGTFASPANAHDLFANIGKGMLVWPSGAVTFPFQLTGAYGVALLAFLLVNTALWVILLYAGWQVARALRQAPEKPESKLQAVLLIWALGALSFCMLTRPQTRFGASLYVFLLLFLAYFLFARSGPRYLRLLPILLLSFVTLVKGGNFLWTAVANASAERRDEKTLFAGLRSLPQDGRAVFVVNAPTMLSAPRFLPRAWISNSTLFSSTNLADARAPREEMLGTIFHRCPCRSRFRPVRPMSLPVYRTTFKRKHQPVVCFAPASARTNSPITAQVSSG